MPVEWIANTRLAQLSPVFLTLKDAREFRESGETKKTGPARSGDIVTVADGIEKWLEVCEKEGRDGRDPVTDFTLKGYKYRAKIVKSYPWKKSLQELTAPDIIEFRSWLRTTRARWRTSCCRVSIP
jgi:hypothetical protein